MSATYKANSGFTRRIVRERQAVACMHHEGERLASSIRDAIPVVTGQAKAEYGALDVTVEMKDGAAAAKIRIGSPIWHLLEFGSINNPPYAPIRKGADSAGYDIDMGSAGG